MRDADRRRRTAAKRLLLPLVSLVVLGAMDVAAAEGAGREEGRSVSAQDGDLRASIGKRVTLRGKAADAKAGAVILIAQGLVYVQDLSAWPAEQIDRDVIVTGVLKRRKGMADRDADGALRQVIAGDWFELEQATWRLAD